MTDGLVLTLVGVLFVFAFLVLLVLAMTGLRIVMKRFGDGRQPDGPVVAAIAAALRAHGGEQR